MKLAVIERMAMEGVKEMQVLVGFLKENGIGYPRNVIEARDWYRRAAEAGSGVAQYMLFYSSGPEKRQVGPFSEADAAVAADWLKKSADRGFAPAQLALSIDLSIAGSNSTEAYRLALAAAEQGYARAARRIGTMHEEGWQDSPPNPLLALTWFKKAAALGDAEAAEAVARMLTSGKGVDIDPSEALRWHFKAFEMKSAAAASSLAQVFRFGLLGQAKDAQKANFYAAEAKRLRKWWAESLGLQDRSPRSFFQRLLETARRRYIGGVTDESSSREAHR